MRNSGVAPDRFWAWAAIVYGALLFLAFGFCSLITLMLAMNVPAAGVCLGGSLLIGFPLLAGGVLALEGNRTFEIWWMICGGAALAGIVALPGYTSGDLSSTVFLVPPLVAGIPGAIRRFGRKEI